MTGFTIDRVNLPKPWERPLIFALIDGSRTMRVEISREAALEYIEAGRSHGAVAALAFQRREDFLQAVEAAVEYQLRDNRAEPEALTLGWSDLYPK